MSLPKILGELKEAKNFVIGTIAGGWPAFVGGDIYDGTYLRPLIAAGGAYYLWTVRGSVLEAYALGAGVYLIAAQNEAKKLGLN